MKLQIFLLAACLAVIGCEKEHVKAKTGPTTPAVTEDETSPAPPPEAARPASDPTLAKPAGKPPTVTLLEPGAEPRHSMRLAVKKGDVQPASMVLGMDMELVMQGAPMPKTKLPATKMNMTATVTDVMDNGDIRWEMAVTGVEILADPDVAPQVVAAMEQSMTGITGFTGHAVVTSRGFIKDADFSLPPDANPQMVQLMDGMRQSMAQLTSPMPEQDVGLGATWQVETKIEQNGMTIDQLAAYELTAVDGNRFTAKITLTQNADQQQIAVPNMPSAKAELLYLKSTGNGETTFQLDKLIPPSGKLQLAMEMKTTAEAMGQSQTMEMKLTMDMTITGQ